MRTQHILKLAGFFSLLFILRENSYAQAKLVLNGAKINIANGANLVLANPAPDAIIRQSGHIISEGENNLVKWNMANNTGSYTVPFGFGSSAYLPLIFTRSAGSGSGNYLFSTYQTSWQNSSSLPTGVTNLTSGDHDNSASVLDRFWRIDAKGYTTVPSLTNLSFTYLENELSDQNNNITESALGLQGWNENTKSWSDFQPLGEIDANSNKLTVASFPTDGPYKWWALVDKTSPLPLELISFDARRTNNAVVLDWATANEVNCQNFEIQKSIDAINFSTIATRPAANGSLNNYTYLDLSPAEGISYYRLKQNDKDGESKYTQIRTVDFSSNTEVTIYPNPTHGRTVHISLKNFSSEYCSIVLTDMNGRSVCSFEKKIDQNSTLLEFPGSVRPGMYFLKIFNNNYSVRSKLLIE